MKEKILELIDKIKGKGYEIEVVDRRPEINIARLDTLALSTDTEKERLTKHLKYLVFYKSDELKETHSHLTDYLTKIERLEYLTEHGEYSQDAEDIASYILGDSKKDADE